MGSIATQRRINAPAALITSMLAYALVASGYADSAIAAEPKRGHPKSNTASSSTPAASAAGQTVDPRRHLKTGSVDPCAAKSWADCTARAMILRQSRAVQEKAQAHQSLVQACDAGFARACSEVGRDLAEGVGVAKDLDVGLKLMRDTCSPKLNLCNNLGVAHYFGWSGQPDLVEAARLYMRGCRAGEQAGCANWATMILDEEAEGDRANALILLRKACAVSLAMACHNLGVFYHQPKIGSPDYARAHEYYGLGCTGGNAAACNNLGTLFEAGHGVKQDFGTAAKLYAFACDFGVATSCRRLGILYAHGAGVAKDDAKARALFRAACDSGDKRACGAETP